MLGILWAIACLWLGYLGSHWVLPGVLLAGLLALWGWRHVEWLWWFPAVLVAATMLEPLSPLPMRSRFGPLVYIDLLTIGVAVVAMVRAVGLRLPLLPRTPVDGLVAAMLGLFVVGLSFPEAKGHVLMDLKQFVVRLVVFYATTTVASRPLGSRWVWLAFPMASALIGVHAIWARSQGPSMIAVQAQAADVVWGSRHGIFNALLVALPVTVGLAIDAGQAGARAVWMLACLFGSVALAVHLQGTDVLQVGLGRSRWTVFELCRTTLACVTLLTLAWLSWKVRTGRRHEGPRWSAVMVTFVLFGVFELLTPALAGPAIPLLAVAAGLVAGTLRADRRAIRSGRRIEPPLEEAA
jgi:hypothetical protein